jgi:LacI family transcriptional regulator
MSIKTTDPICVKETSYASDRENKKVRDRKTQRRATLKTVAQRLGLSAGTISSVLNDSPGAKSIPQKTKERVLAAARELNYQPNFFARSLRTRQSGTIGIMAPKIDDPSVALLVSGIESFLREENYFFFLGIHDQDPVLFENCSTALMLRGAEGFIVVDLILAHPLPVPTVSIATQQPLAYYGSVGIRADCCPESGGISLKGVGRTAAETLLCQIKQDQFSLYARTV